MLFRGYHRLIIKSIMPGKLGGMTKDEFLRECEKIIIKKANELRKRLAARKAAREKAVHA